MTPIKFLKQSGNSKVAEAIATRALISALSLEAANDCTHIEVYFPNIDRDGYDLIIEHQEEIKKYQLKTVIGKTASWEIARRLLRPNPYNCEKLGYPGTFDGTGIEGGVILSEISEQNGRIHVTYRYTDIYIIYAFEQGIISRSPKTPSTIAYNKHIELGADVFGSIQVSDNLFLTPKTEKDLVSLMGLSSLSDESIQGPFKQSHRWREHVLLYGTRKHEGRETSAYEAYELLTRICKETLHCLI